MSKIAEQFLDLACLNYTRDGFDRHEQGRALLADNPRIPATNLATAACTGEPQEVARILGEDPELVNATFAPRGWPALLYLCYSRACRDGVGAARVLLEHGADPNAHFFSHGIYRFTALTGAFGEGEKGPRAQPPHPQSLEIAQLLLAHGADPNDGQALYNTMFTPGSECLDLLLRHGLSAEARCNWFCDQESAPTLVHYQLMHAARKGYLDRVERLAPLVDLDLPDEDGMTPWRVAWLNGHIAVADRLVTLGATKGGVSPVDDFRAAVLSGDRTRAHSSLLDDALKEDPTILHKAAGAGNVPAIELLLNMGVEVNRFESETPLHSAAWSGQVPAIKVLLSRGADPTIRDARFSATPLAWAEYNGQSEAIEVLRQSAGSG